MTIATQCPSDDMLRRYAIGDYTDLEGDSVEAHLTICKACEETLAGFDNADDSLVRHMPLVAPPVGEDEEPSWLRRLTNGTARPNYGAEMKNSADADLVGSTEERDFGAYELTGILGRGGMGVVYAATHRRLGKPIAIKVVSPKLVAAEEAQRRFERETKVLGTLNHSGIVSATDAGTIGGAAYLAMERVDGVNLAKLVQHVGPLRADEACEIGRQIALALAAAHEAGAIHRDIKPSNVMIDRDGRVKLLDFGLAHLSTALTTQTETSLGKLLGTLDYMAPEQAAGDEVGPAADIFGLGATIFFLLTGRSPRSKGINESLIRQLRRIADDPADSLADYRADAPQKLSTMLSSLMSLDPAERCESAAAVADQLSGFLSEGTTESLRRIAADLPPVDTGQSRDQIDQSLEMLLGGGISNGVDEASSPSDQDLSSLPLPDAGNSRIGRKLLIAVGGLGFLGAVLGIVLVLQTTEGTVRIDSELSGVTLDFVDGKDRVTGIEINQGKNEAELRTGRYIVKFRDPQFGFVISPNDFRVDDTRDISVRVYQLPQHKRKQEMKEATESRTAVDLREEQPSHDVTSFGNAADFLSHVRAEMQRTEGQADRLKVASEYLSGKRGDGMAAMNDIQKAIASLELFADVCALLYRGRSNFDNESCWDCFQEVRKNDVHYWRGRDHIVDPKQMLFNFIRLQAERYLRESLQQIEPTVLASLVNGGESDVRAAAILAIVCRQAKSLENRSTRPHPFPTVHPHLPEDTLRWKVHALASVIILDAISKGNGNDRQAATSVVDSLSDLLCGQMTEPIEDTDGEIAAELLSISKDIGASDHAYSQLIMARLIAHPDSSDIHDLLRMRNTPNELSSGIYFKRADIDNLRHSFGYYCDGWPGVAQQVLGDLVEEDHVSELEIKLVKSLELLVPVIQADRSNRDRISNDLRRTSDVLKKRLQRYYVADGQPAQNVHWEQLLPSSPEQMLTLISWIDGRIPDFVSEGLPISSIARERVRLLQNVVDNLDDDYGVYVRHQKEIRDVASIAPFQTLKAILVADEFPVANMTATRALQVTTKRPDERLERNDTYQAVDPFLLLAVYREFVTDSPQSSTNFRYLLRDAGVAAFNEPLRNVLDSQSYVRQTLLAQLSDLARHAPDEQTRAAVLDFDSRIAEAAETSFADTSTEERTTVASDQSKPAEDVDTEDLDGSTRVKVFIDAAGKPRVNAAGPALTVNELVNELSSKKPPVTGIKIIADRATSMQSMMAVYRAIHADPKLTGIVIGMEANDNSKGQSKGEPVERSQITNPSIHVSTLYAGKTLPQWQAIFDAERNPIAKIEAGKALVMLTDSLPPAERLNRILDIAGDLIKEGFGPQPSEYLMDYLGGRASVARAMRWPKGFQDLSDAWFHFDQLCESRVEGLSASILADGLLRVINDHSADPKVAMAFSLLFDYSIRINLSEAGLADQVLRNSWDINNFVHARAIVAAASYYYEKGNAETKQSFTTRYSELGRRLKTMAEPNVEHQIQWIERVEINQVEIEPPELAAEFAFDLLKKHPAKILDELLHIEPLDPTTEEPMVLSEHDFEQAAKRYEVFWKYWLPLCEGYLGGGPTDIEAKRAVFSSLNVALRLRQQGRDDKAVSNIATMLQNQWKQGVVDVAATDVRQTQRRMTPLELLTLLLHCGGELPEESGGDSKLLASFREHCEATFKDARDYKPIDRFNGLLIDYPIAVIRMAMEANHLPQSMTPIVAAGYTSPIGRSNEAGPRIDPLVTLAVCLRIAGKDNAIDRRIAEQFQSEQPEFSLPLKRLLDQDTASSELAHKMLTQLRDKAIDPVLSGTVDRYLPGEAKNRAAFIEANPGSLLAILERHNDRTREVRQQRFDPPIPDLTMQRLRVAFEDGVRRYRKSGEHAIADTLQLALDDGRLPKRLVYSGTGGGVARDADGDRMFRQYTFMLNYEVTPKSLKAVILPEAELRWSLHGWSSTDWGDIHPPLTGDWELTEIKKDDETLDRKAYASWIRKHAQWSQIDIKDNEWIRLGDVTNENHHLKLDYEAGPGGVLKIIDNESVLYEARFMTDGFIDNTRLKLYLNIDGGPPPKTFKIKGTDAVKLTYQRRGTQPAPKLLSRSYDVSDIPVAERDELRNLLKRLAMSRHGISTISNLTDKPNKWFVFTTPEGHQRVKTKLEAWRKGDHLVPPGTPPPAVQMKGELQEAEETEPADKKADDPDDPDDRHGNADPSNPHVRLLFHTESGEPAQGVSVRLDQTGVKGGQPVWAEGVTGGDGVAMDRVLRFGYYRMKITTPDGWSTYVKNVAIEFGKSLDTTIVVPDPGLGAELQIDALPDLQQNDILGKMKFGTLRDYLTQSNLRSGGYSPVRTPEPNQTSKTFANFPDAGSGIEEIAVRLRLQVTRELANPLINTESQPITWKWSFGDFADDGIFLTNSEVRVCKDLDSRSTLPTETNPYFEMPSNVHRLEYLALKLGESKAYPYRVAIPTGQVKLMLVGICGRPSDQVMQAIKTLPLENDEHAWLTTELRPESEWVKRLVDEPWFYAKDPGNYYGHLSRIERTLSDGESLEIKLGSRASANEWAKPNSENESATEEEAK